MVCFGENCDECSYCIGGTCNIDGTCYSSCKDIRRYGSSCQRYCNDGIYLINNDCVGKCNCKKKRNCFVNNGSCLDGICKEGWEGHACQKACDGGWFGENCASVCHCKNDTICDMFTGNCLDGCASGYTGVSCQISDKKDSSSYTTASIFIVVVCVVAIAIVVALLILYRKRLAKRFGRYIKSPLQSKSNVYGNGDTSLCGSLKKNLKSYNAPETDEQWNLEWHRPAAFSDGYACLKSDTHLKTKKDAGMPLGDSAQYCENFLNLNPKLKNEISNSAKEESTCKFYRPVIDWNNLSIEKTTTTGYGSLYTSLGSSSGYQVLNPTQHEKYRDLYGQRRFKANDNIQNVITAKATHSKAKCLQSLGQNVYRLNSNVTDKKLEYPYEEKNSHYPYPRRNNKNNIPARLIDRKFIKNNNVRREKKARERRSFLDRTKYEFYARRFRDDLLGNTRPQTYHLRYQSPYSVASRGGESVMSELPRDNLQNRNIHGFRSNVSNTQETQRNGCNNMRYKRINVLNTVAGYPRETLFPQNLAAPV